MKIILLIITITMMFHNVYGHVWPSGGATEQPLTAGTQIAITWDDVITAQQVSLELWDGERAVRTQIASHVPANSKRYVWTLPEDLPSGRHYRFVVRDEVRTNIAVYSHGFATIVPSRPIISTVDSDASPSLAVSMEPQPATDRLRATWSVEDVTQLEVRDVAGQLYWNQSIHPATSTVEIDTQSLPSGAYTLVMYRVNGQTSTRPFMIKR
ncbi:MAG TPA: Ser-Thr-rich GPI-anchored membrane family protein [Candidatus Didemnitutus sp.]|nr:Ser-Thr-rich GPI-anchored membrane family protein [Candidatus Didemnitutus sp.]